MPIGIRSPSCIKHSLAAAHRTTIGTACWGISAFRTSILRVLWDSGEIMSFCASISSGNRRFGFYAPNRCTISPYFPFSPESSKKKCIKLLVPASSPATDAAVLRRRMPPLRQATYARSHTLPPRLCRLWRPCSPVSPRPTRARLHRSTPWHLTPTFSCNICSPQLQYTHTNINEHK